MLAEGETYRRIGEKYGLDGEKVRELVRRHRRKEAKIAIGIEIKSKGRPRTRHLTETQKQERRIYELEQEMRL